MSKVYILAICLLAASFTGCLSDDTTDTIEQDNTDETIEPVGMNNNETDDYDELIAEIQNLTDEVNSLKSDMNNMLYDPAENSTVSMYRGNNDYINFTKVGNTIHVNSTHGLGSTLWFEDNNGIVIELGEINQIADRCNHNGTWYPITNTSACSGTSENIIYEVNLVREPLTVSYGNSWSFYRGESFP